MAVVDRFVVEKSPMVQKLKMCPQSVVINLGLIVIVKNSYITKSN